ncbi:MAG: type III secretion system chaperone [Desulfovibrio sp.]|jgi:hypothetical protein|nr:type III secretion system chaperone [Desulfovibrio sp.]
MNYKEEAAALVKTLGEYIDDPSILLDSLGRCSTVIENIPFSFFYGEKEGCLFIQALVGNGHGLHTTALERLLAGNHLWASTAGGIFGLNPEDENIYYSYRLDFPISVDPDVAPYAELLCDIMPLLVGAIEKARDTVEEEAHVSEQTAPPRELVDPSSLA